MDDLQAFEDVRAVVETRARRVQIEWPVWFDLRWGPSIFRREIHVEHVVCHDLSDLGLVSRLMEKHKDLVPPQTRGYWIRAIFWMLSRG